MYKTTRLISCTLLFREKNISNFLHDCKTIKHPSPVSGRKCPVTMLLLKLYHKISYSEFEIKKEINMIFCKIKSLQVIKFLDLLFYTFILIIRCFFSKTFSNNLFDQYK